MDVHKARVNTASAGRDLNSGTSRAADVSTDEIASEVPFG